MSYDSMYGGYSTHPLPTRNSERAERNVPKYVKELAEKIEKEEDKEPDYAFPVAWSVYCKYKKPDSPHCKKNKSEYFPSRKASVQRIARRYMNQ
jgi:hypothetical protein